MYMSSDSDELEFVQYQITSASRLAHYQSMKVAQGFSLPLPAGEQGSMLPLLTGEQGLMLPLPTSEQGLMLPLPSADLPPMAQSSPISDISSQQPSVGQESIAACSTITKTVSIQPLQTVEWDLIQI